MNPWSEAAATSANKANSKNVSLKQQQQPIRRSSRQAQFSTCGALSTLRSLVKLWHILDALVGVILTVYGLSLLSSHLYLPICLLLGMGVLLCIRSVAGLSGLWLVSDDFMGRCGLRVSAYLSPLVAIVFFVLSCLCAMGNNNHAFTTYLRNHHKELHLPSKWLEQQHTHHVLWMTFSIATLCEMIRWYLVPRLHQWLVAIDTHHMDSIVATTTTTPTTTPRRKPWWWQHDQTDTAGDDHLHDPLLLENDYPWALHSHNNQSYSIHDGTSQQQDISFWSKWFGSDRKEEVSFQSVQEEWASKSEEDPVWWSREEEEEEPTTTTCTKKESWTGETL